MIPGVRRVQVVRRMVQLFVVAFMLTMPAVARYNNYLSAHQLDRMLEKWQGTPQGDALGLIDSAMRMLPGGQGERGGRTQRNRSRLMHYAQQFRGSPWSAEVGGLSMTDPLAGAESIAASRRVPWVLIAGLVVPLIATILLGRVFCSWICPMGFLLELTDKLRGVLRFLEIHPRNLRLSRRVKYALLGTGLLLAALLSTPVLGYVYPPAILSRELHDVVFAAFDRAEIGRFGLGFGGLSWMMLVPAAIVLMELTVSRRWWCRYVCPGGALYSLLGWARPVRVKLAASRCNACALCTAACPMGLNPMKNRMGMECDNCGVCISACDQSALDYGFAAPLIAARSAGAPGKAPVVRRPRATAARPAVRPRKVRNVR
ncbi:MAG: 4Fe-4S binding protein [Candidatus Binatia bacterium]